MSSVSNIYTDPFILGLQQFPMPEVPEDAQFGGAFPKGSTQHPEHVKARMENMDYEKVSKTLKNRYKNQPHHSLGRKNGRPSDETIEKIRNSNKGKKKDNSSGLMGQYWKGKEKHTLCCIGCQKPVSPSRIGRHGKCFKEYTSR